MGHDINKLVEVDVRKVAKRLVSAEAPCSAELGKFMDCMKRHPQDPESLCAAERAALVACAGRQTRGARDMGAEKRRLARQLQNVVSSWKRFGY